MERKDILKLRVNDIKAVVELERNFGWWISEKYGTPEYWDRLEKEMEDAFAEFNSFIRDHRSRDTYSIYAERVYTQVCKFCKYEWPDGYEGIIDCCQDALDAQGIEIIYKKEANDE